MSHDSERTCACMATHRPQPLELNRHHIWPLYLGGPDNDDNIAWICPTTHTNVHELLRIMLLAGPLDWGQVGVIYDVPVSRYAYGLAVEGLRRYNEETGVHE